MKHKIRFLPDGKSVDIEEGMTLLAAQISAGLTVDAPCGGNGTCKKCEVEYRRPGETEYTRALACQTHVFCDLEVRPTEAEDAVGVLVEGKSRMPMRQNPMARAVRLQVAPCLRGESTSDWTRLRAAISSALGARVWRLSVPACRTLSRQLIDAKGEVWVVISGDWVLEVTSKQPRVLVSAFDLGTTTIAGYLLDAATGRTIATCGMRNPQAKYGADVISRADYALNHGVDALSLCAREALQSLIAEMCTHAAVEPECICAISLAGNTAMHHLFLAISPDSLVRAPYNPTVNEALSLRASDYGFRVHPWARLFMLPVIGGFVGADTVACLLSGNWRHRKALTLMIDIGTNGELVLGNMHRRVACSTAAGPALEGAKIACGMRASNGAIDRVWLENGALRWHVIGEGSAKGLCGSGLVDLVASLLKNGELDESGRLISSERIELPNTGVFLSQKDVREVQLAKAAIAAGIRIMARKLSIRLDQIEEVDIAGAFGNYIDPDSACNIGLIPAILRDRIVPVGNAAGEGAKLTLLDEDYWRDAKELAQETEFLELATIAEFQDEFVEQLSFADEDE